MSIFERNENLTNNKKRVINVLMNIVRLSKMVHAFLKYEIKNWDQFQSGLFTI